MDHPIRTLIVDNDARFREATRALLEDTEGMMAVGEARDEQEATALVRELKPDVILIDVNTVPLDSLQSVVPMDKPYPDSKVILLGVRGQEHLVLEGFRRGAHGHLVKGESQPFEIIEAIRAVNRGESVLNPHMAGWILDEMARKRQCQLANGKCGR